MRHEPILTTTFCLQEEATAGRQRISHPSCLGEALQNNAEVRPPYTYNQIQESVRHREIINIFRTASDTTRPFYAMGSYFNGGNEENWVVRWCLYHSFRYTDNRNRRTNRPGASSASTPARGGWPDDNLDSESPLSPPGDAGGSVRSQSQSSGRETGKSRYFLSQLIAVPCALARVRVGCVALHTDAPICSCLSRAVGSGLALNILACTLHCGEMMAADWCFV